MKRETILKIIDFLEEKEGKEIPEMNCLPHYDEEQLIQIYDNIEKNFNELNHFYYDLD